MMTIFKKLFIKASILPAFNIGLIFALMGIAFMVSMGLVFFDIALTQLYIENTRLFPLSFDLICVSFLLFFVGAKSYFLYTQKGYSSTFSLSILLIVLYVALYAFLQNMPYALRFLFVLKYIVTLLFSSAFFSILSRFIPVNFTSFSFMAVLTALFLGCITAGLLVYTLTFGSFGFLYLSFVLLLLCYSAFYILTLLKPVKKQVFCIKSGVQKSGLISCIYLFAFGVLCAKCLIDFAFFKGLMIAFSGYGILKYMALWWAGFGLIGLFALFILYKARLYSVLFGSMLVLIASIALTAVGVYMTNLNLVLAGSVFFMLTFVLFYQGYINALLHALTPIFSQNIHKMRMRFVQPVGFMTGAILIMHFAKNDKQFLFLLALSFLLLLILMISFHIYNKLIMKSFYIMKWPENGVMLTSKRVLTYIKNQLTSSDFNTIVYFLSILEISNYKLYVYYILKFLRHDDEEVKLFVLDRLSKIDEFDRYEKRIQHFFQTEESIRVKRKMLAMLIVLASQQKNEDVLHQYSFYLEDENFKPGAMIGFLTCGGSYRDLAVKLLQELMDSNKNKDKLLALNIMLSAPNRDLSPLLTYALKSNSAQVIKKAISVAGEVTSPESLPFILNALDDYELKEGALATLKQYGGQAYPFIEKKLMQDDVAPSIKQTLILFLIASGDIYAYHILLRILKGQNYQLRHLIAKSFVDNDIFWQEKGKYQLLKAGITLDYNCIIYLNGLVQKYQNHSFVDAGEAFSFLLRACKTEIFNRKEAVLYQLLLLKQARIYQSAIYILLGDDSASYPMALGILQDTLPKNMYEMIYQIMHLEAGQQNALILTENAVDDLMQLVKNNGQNVSPWLIACALNCLGKLGDNRAIDVIIDLLQTKNQLMLQSAIIAYRNLESDVDKMHHTLLQVPTSILLANSLTPILES